MNASKRTTFVSPSGRAIRLLALVGVIVVMVAALGLAVAPGTHASGTLEHRAVVSERSSASTNTSSAVTFAAVGDSMTEWTIKTATTSNPWVYVAQSSNLRFVGGFAASGDKTFEMLAGMKAQSAFSADVLVILAGRNDVTLMQDYPSAWTVAQGMSTIQAIAATAGIKHVLLSAIAPCGVDCDAWNAALKSLAAAEHWSWVDPWTSLTDPSTDLYYPSLTVDGVHPTSFGYTIVGNAIHKALETMCSDDACVATIKQHPLSS
jgi:lysophospholipase L1-like esterase